LCREDLKVSNIDYTTLTILIVQEKVVVFVLRNNQTKKDWNDDSTIKIYAHILLTIYILKAVSVHLFLFEYKTVSI